MARRYAKNFIKQSIPNAFHEKVARTVDLNLGLRRARNQEDKT